MIAAARAVVCSCGIIFYNILNVCIIVWKKAVYIWFGALMMLPMR